jgi:adenylylsulfate kinase
MATGLVLWFTGLSRSGKTTVSRLVVDELRRRGVRIELLDGDAVRTNLSQGLGYSKEDPDANILRVGFVANLLSRNGLAACCACISPYAEVRSRVRARVEGDGGRFVEIYMDTPLQECMRRDVKGLYGRALAGEIRGFTGVDDPYEPPAHAEIVLKPCALSPAQSAAVVVAYLEREGLIPNAAR